MLRREEKVILRELENSTSSSHRDIQIDPIPWMSDHALVTVTVNRDLAGRALSIIRPFGSGIELQSPTLLLSKLHAGLSRKIPLVQRRPSRPKGKAIERGNVDISQESLNTLRTIK